MDNKTNDSVNTLSLREKVDSCINVVFPHVNYHDFWIEFSNEIDEAHRNTLYKADGCKIISFNNSSNVAETQLCCILKEVAHHICYKKYDELNRNNKRFKDIHNKLLIASFKLEYINPYRLLCRYSCLVDSYDTDRITDLCYEYFKSHPEIEPQYFSCLEFEYDKELIKYLKELHYIFYHNLNTNVKYWYRFFNNAETVSQIEESLKDEGFDIDTSHSLDGYD